MGESCCRFHYFKSLSLNYVFFFIKYLQSYVIKSTIHCSIIIIFFYNIVNYMSGITSGARMAYLSEASEITPGFRWRLNCSFLVFCVCCEIIAALYDFMQKYAWVDTICEIKQMLKCQILFYIHADSLITYNLNVFSSDGNDIN